MEQCHIVPIGAYSIDAGSAWTIDRTMSADRRDAQSVRGLVIGLALSLALWLPVAIVLPHLF